MEEVRINYAALEASMRRDGATLSDAALAEAVGSKVMLGLLLAAGSIEGDASPGAAKTDLANHVRDLAYPEGHESPYPHQNAINFLEELQPGAVNTALLVADALADDERAIDKRKLNEVTPESITKTSSRRSFLGRIARLGDRFKNR